MLKLVDAQLALPVKDRHKLIIGKIEGGTGNNNPRFHWHFVTGKWTLTGANTYTGNTSISGGTLEIGGAGQLGSGSYAGNVSIASGQLLYNSSANQTLSGIISGGGTLTKSTGGSSTLTLSGANTYTGATTVNAGVLQAGIAYSAGSGAFGNGTSAVTLANTSGVALDLNSYNTQIGSLSGGGSTGGNVTNSGAGTLTLSAPNADLLMIGRHSRLPNA